MTTLSRPCIYDTLPNLDSWYECKNQELNEPYRTVPCTKKRTTNGCVSFSSAPPAVYHYEENNKPERPNHRRTSSSEHGTFCLFFIII